MRSLGHDRQLSWILRGDHPSRKGFRVDRPTVISEASRAWLAPKMGLEQQPALARPPAEGLRPTAPIGMGVDLARGLALFGFPDRATAEALGARAVERRNRAARAESEVNSFEF